ncbi:FAD-dependent oxidoreductase [Atopococcus tabaci]|uniref:FAD-dependent oxidoreductase n=1 Tax=Atopococcus tabaci TaxID=269774 RepID=UPI0003F7BEEA|nr:FAD-dependent oxidoreductase [Atopococcus tabaci]
MNVVIIGASFGGISAALQTRKKHPQATVILLEKTSSLGYLPSGLNLLLSGSISSLDEAYFMTAKELKEKGIQVYLDTEVRRVDLKEKSVVCATDSGSDVYRYDKLIVAAGSTPYSHKIIGTQSTKVLTYKQRAQAEEAWGVIQRSRHVAVIGGGQAGIEAAEALHENGKQVTVVESMDNVLFKSFDSEMIQPLQEEMIRKGVDLKFHRAVTAIEEQGEQLVLHLGDESAVCDAALLSVNVRPDLAFLDGQLPLNVDGTLMVDEYLRTEDLDVFGVGDCVQTPFPLTGESFYMPLANNAVRTGMTAAENLMEPVRPFVGSVRTVAAQAFGWYIASTGLTEAETQFYARPVRVHHKETKTSMLPDAETVHLKYITDADTEVLLGVQLISKENILQAINTFALAVQTEQPMDTLTGKEYFFQAGFTDLVDVTNLEHPFERG